MLMEVTKIHKINSEEQLSLKGQFTLKLKLHDATRGRSCGLRLTPVLLKVHQK